MLISLLFSEPLLFFAWAVAMVIAITVHEFSHAWAAYRLGDKTAESQGRLTLNPLSHLDWLGTILLLFVGFGWGKPVPFNPYNLKNQKWGPALIALAGPTSNFILAIVFALLLRLVTETGWIAADNLAVQFFVSLININVILMVFNLIPIPPLDGSKVLYEVINLKQDIRNKLEMYGPYILLFFLIFGSSLFGYIFSFALKGITMIVGL